MLETEEAARRLGVKPATLYAYVSRGQLVSHRAPGARRRSLFAVEDVEALARRSRADRPGSTRVATVSTAVTQIRPVGPVYRGVPAVELAGTRTFGEVAALLWGEEAGTAADWAAVDLGDPPPRPRDALRWAVVMAGAADPLRGDRRPRAVTRAARRVLATMAASLHPPPGRRVAASAAPGAPSREDAGAAAEPLAAALVRASGVRGPAELPSVLDAALVLLADHELASSTLAVRVAASTRADCYDALLAGLGVLGGPLHGSASVRVSDLLATATADGPSTALERALRFEGAVPGFGHGLYPDGDPRARRLLELAEPLVDPRLADVVGEVVALAAARGLPPPNVDFALAVLCRAGGLGADAGETVFTVARCAGWVAHYLEELGEPPLRFRVRAVSVAPR